MNEIKEVFLENLKVLREEKFSQQEMADKLEITRAMYSAYEAGRSILNLDRIEQICKILEVSPAALFSESNRKEKLRLDLIHWVNKIESSDLESIVPLIVGMIQLKVRKK